MFRNITASLWHLNFRLECIHVRVRQFPDNFSLPTPICKFLFLEVQCPPPPIIQHGTHSGVGRQYGDVIMYRCDPERQLSSDDTYRLTDGRTETSTVCQQNEMWSESELSCQRGLYEENYYTIMLVQFRNSNSFRNKQKAKDSRPRNLNFHFISWSLSSAERADVSRP